jgi:hypothetical protein
MIMMIRTAIIIIIIIIYSNNSFNGKCRSVFGPKFTRPPGNLDYWGPDYRKTALFITFTHTLCNTYTASSSPHLAQIMPYITKLRKY